MDSYHRDKSAETPQHRHSHGDRERRKPAVEVEVEEENTDPLYALPPSHSAPPHSILWLISERWRGRHSNESLPLL